MDALFCVSTVKDYEDDNDGARDGHPSSSALHGDSDSSDDGDVDGEDTGAVVVMMLIVMVIMMITICHLASSI